MEELDKRISRIIGQMRGIQKMAKESRDCIDILQQVAALKKAIDGLTKEIIMTNLEGELPAPQQKKVKEMIDRAINL